MRSVMRTLAAAALGAVTAMALLDVMRLAYGTYIGPLVVSRDLFNASVLTIVFLLTVIPASAGLRTGVRRVSGRRLSPFALAIPAALLAYILFLSGWQLLNAMSPDPDVGTFWESVRFAVRDWPATMCLLLPMALTSCCRWRSRRCSC